MYSVDAVVLKARHVRKPTVAATGYRVEISCTIYCLCTAGDVCRNTFTEKEDEEQHNYDHGHNNDHGEQDEEKDEQLNGWNLIDTEIRKLI